MKLHELFLVKLSKTEKQSLFWLLTAAGIKEYKRLLGLISYIYYLIDERFHILEKEQLISLIHSECVDLLSALKEGKIRIKEEKNFEHYIENRINRIVRNAYSQRLIFLSTDYLRRDGYLTLYLPERREKALKRKIRRVKKEKTRRRELGLLLGKEVERITEENQLQLF